jgi:hypothetical protein
VELRSDSIQPAGKSFLFQIEPKSQNGRSVDTEVKDMHRLRLLTLNSHSEEWSFLRKVQLPIGYFFGESSVEFYFLEVEGLACEDVARGIDRDVGVLRDEFQRFDVWGFFVLELQGRQWVPLSFA